MTYDELVSVNKTIKTTPIKGKQYAEVNERIKAFRKLFPNGTISTEIVSLEKEGDGTGVCVFKAIIMNENGAILATGHAYENEGSTFINKTSYIENAETSAVGRALGMLGIGIDTSVASFEEVSNAIRNQETEPTKETPKTAKRPLTKEDKEARALFVDVCKQYELKGSEVAVKYKLTNESTPEEFYKAIKAIKGLPNE